MNKEDYFKYYIQGSDHYLIPKDVFKELFNEMVNWKQDTQKYKEVINKAIKYIKSKEYQYGDEEQDNYDYDIGFDEVNELLDILKEVKTC